MTSTYIENQQNTPQALVIAKNLRRTFVNGSTGETVVALNDLNLNIYEGQMTALIGPDGAGKTTFIRHVCGLMFADSGELEVFGKEVNAHAQEIQDELSYMPQKFGLYEDLSIMENMTLYADLHGVPQEIRKKRFAQLLDMTGLTPFTERLAGKLSGGMKQKLGLACTLVRSPKLLLLDEPTVGVDPLSRRELWEIIKKLVASEKLTVLVSTAYMDEAELCDHVIVLHNGHIITQGTPASLRQLTHGLCFEITPPASIPCRIIQANLLDDTEHVMDAVPTGGKVRFIARQNTNLAELDVYKYFGSLPTTAVPERLEDSFMMLLHQASEGNADAKQSLQGFELDYSKNYALTDEVDIRVKNLVRKFGDFVAVANTSFDVHRGEIFGLLGPNGAGKTTTFRMLCGLLPASSGELSVVGVNLRHARQEARANVGYVAQKFSLYSNLTVDENLEFYAGAYGLSNEQIEKRMAEVKIQFELTEKSNMKAGELPGGYKQRLSMAAALMHKPRILFLDEPTSGIDPLARRNFWRQITSLAANGTTIIITTHFMEEAEYCDRIMIQDQGKCLALGTTDEMRHHNGKTLATMNDAFIAIVEDARSAKKEA